MTTAVRISGRLVGALVPLALVLLTGGIVEAKEAGIVIHGWGKADCTRFLEVRRAGGRLEQTLRQWVFGFVSAYNILAASGGYGLNGADASTIIGLVDRACTQDPSLKISGAVNSILGDN